MKPLLTLLLFVFAGSAFGQVCTGGLGDPIINITFGAGSNFGPPLAPGITNMDYQSQGCVLDNAYEIVNSMHNCYVGDWLDVSADHTGDANGYFMLIGASNQPSDFYVQKVNGLCPGTSYQFAVWVLNMASHTGEILPNITFNIEKTDGTILQSLSTGDIPVSNPLKWNQYAFYFSTPPGVSSVVLRMRNNAPGGYGNDLALDDITFRPVGPKVSVTIAGHTGDTVTMCPSPANNLKFLATVENCYSSTFYQWQVSTDDGKKWMDISGAVNTVYPAFPTATGNYLYRVAVGEAGNAGISTCQVVSKPDTIVILKESSPAVSITSDLNPICAGAPANFTAVPTDQGPTPHYQWVLNGMPSGTDNPWFSGNVFNDGDQIRCVMTSDAVCPTNPLALSNTISMTVLPHIVPLLTISSSATSICSDSLVKFVALPVNGGSRPDYQWMVNGQQVGTDTSVYSSSKLHNGDIISAIMTSSAACSSSPTYSNAITMTVYQTPVVRLTGDTVIARGSRIRLAPSITGPVLSYQWSPATGLDDWRSPNPLASPLVSTTYLLKVTSPNGCNDTALEKVTVFNDPWMPNAFTPNGDGKNDLFRIPPSAPVDILRFSIFDRWGVLVFTTTNGSEGWDGRFGGQPQPAGMYVWMIEYNNLISKQRIMKKGVVELIR
ncbi:MAG: gliding motility-associated C-terminal domain-containing protein [Chitinophagaceae bacterium]|nr:gliding motility-associated C-terminal domain-containing protein [Chitinophagaceae bacterium]